MLFYYSILETTLPMFELYLILSQRVKKGSLKKFYPQPKYLAK